MGLTSCRRITIAKTLARRRRECAIGHHADCRVAAERYTLICDRPVSSVGCSESEQQLAHEPWERWLVDGDVRPGRSDDDIAVHGDSPYRFG